MKDRTLFCKAKRSSSPSLNNKPLYFSNASQFFTNILVNNLEDFEVSLSFGIGVVCVLPTHVQLCAVCGAWRTFALFNIFPTVLVKGESHKHTVVSVLFNCLFAAVFT